MAVAAKIKAAVGRAQQGSIQNEAVWQNDAAKQGKNEFLFFMKPELTIADQGVALDKVIDLTLAKIEEFGLQIKNIRVLSAEYLAKHNIIAQHYGVINAIAKDAHSMSEGAKATFKEKFGQDLSEANVLGGIQMLEKYPVFNPTSLDFLVQNCPFTKLAGGTYAVTAKLDAEKAYIINGFHPRQLEHFTEAGRSIVVFTLTGDIDWETARENFIGATNPEKAEAGSLRRTFLEKKDELGLAEVSQGSNGVHLSAGPVEGLIELMRYNSDFGSTDGKKSYKDFQFGQQLSEKLSEEQIQRVLKNEDLDVDGRKESIFDLTELKNSDEAVSFLSASL